MRKREPELIAHVEVYTSDGNVWIEDDVWIMDRNTECYSFAKDGECWLFPFAHITEIYIRASDDHSS